MISSFSEGVRTLLAGNMLRESAWGRGLGSELIAGFVTWYRQQTEIVSIVGGVERGNLASRRVLEKSGFLQVEQLTAMATQAEDLYRLQLGPS